MKNLGRFFWGGLLIVIGVLLALKFAGVVTIEIFRVALPVVVAFIGINILANNIKNVTGYLIILLAGALFVRYTLGIEFELKYIFAALLVLAGIAIVAFSFWTKNLSDGENHYVIFAGKNDKVTDSSFKGCNTFCMFGGHEIDLRQINTEGDINIRATAVFGGITVFVPQNVNVNIEGMPIFGGVTNNTNNQKDNPFSINIKGLAVFGGIDVKN